VGAGRPTVHRLRTLILYAMVYLCAGAVFLLPLTMPMVRSTCDFSIYNTGWTGCSQLARRLYESGKEVFPLHAPFSQFRDRLEYRETALLVIGPTRPFAKVDSSFIAEFARGGGTLIVADDFYEANTLLQGLGIEARLSASPVGDLSFRKDPFVLDCYSVDAGHPLTSGVSSFVLNYPAAITGPLPPGARVIATTSSMSWLDLNGDRIWQRTSETQGPFPVLVTIPYGDGEVILLSDPSIFINDMISRPGNDQLVRNLVSHLTSADVRRVYLDEEHHTTPNPVEVFTAVIRRAPDYPRLIAVWSLVTAVIFVVHPRLRRGGVNVFDAAVSLALRILSLGARTRQAPLTPDPVEQAIRTHPDWDQQTLRRIADAAA